jgi:quinoprotein glucose dehydrogenase
MKLMVGIHASIGAVLMGLLIAPGAVAESVVDQHQLGTKYSPLTQINKQNVAKLEPAWEYHTGDLPPSDLKKSFFAFEDQPSLIEGNLVVCSTSRRVIALDPKTGKQRWVFDPNSAQKGERTGFLKCRGIANWVNKSAPADAVCKSRIFLGTADYRLISIDARTGKPCADFGDKGVVVMPANKPLLFPGELIATSVPAIVNDVVVVGSVVADNQRVDAPSGRVLAFDARSGKSLWEFDPVPRKTDDPAFSSWAHGTEKIGAGNVWSSMAVDQARDLVFLPTTSPSGDFFGGNRPGDNRYTTSVVALRGATGEVVWHYQLVHHNVFDYDVPSQPILIDFPHNGKMVPALVQNTKMGLIFIFNRETGEPLIPIEEKRVPNTGASEGEALSKTQPFPVGMATLAPQGFSPDDAWGFTPVDKYLCKKKIEELNYGPIYTPPSEKGTIFQPAMSGGPNWGGGAYDSNSHIMVVPSNRVPLVLTLIRPDQMKAIAGDKGEANVRDGMLFPTQGSPYVSKIAPLLSPLGAPCSAPPWAALSAVNLTTGKLVWEVPLGSLEKLMPIPIPLNYGTPGAGGPLITAGGLVFIGYTLDNKIRAFDLQTGNELWNHDLPAAGISIPVTYEIDGEQYVVIPAGGHSMYGSTLGDSVVAFKLKH